MSDFNPPSTADFAWSQARENADKLEKLAQRIATLERQVEALIRDKHYERNQP